MRKMPFNRAGKAAVLLALSGCMMLGVVSPAAADVRSEEAKQEAAAIAQARRDSAQVQSLMQTDQGGTPTKILSQESTAPEKNVTMTAKNPAGQMVQQTYSKVVTTTSRRKSSDDDDDDEDDKKKENYDTSRGPGARAQDVKLEVRDSEGVTGPQVLEIQMSETYHEDYDVYTQSIEGRFFIYTNVSNNGITDQPVYLDIPGNVSYRAEKDGVPMAYTTKQKVSEMGTYLFYFTAVKDSSKPLAEQIIYETTFNFRIQPKVVRETAAGNSGEGADRYGQEPLPWSYTDVTGDGEVPADGSGAGEVPVNGTWDGAAAGSGTEDGAADGIGTGDGTADGTGTGDGTADGTGTGDGAAVGNGTVDGAADGSGTGDGTADGSGTGDGTAAGSGTGDGTAAGATAGQSDRMVSYQQTYDSQKGLYRITPKQDGSFVLYSNVPNGMITGTAVLLDTAEMGTCRDQMKLLRNGEAYELPEDGILQECGSYTVLIPAGERQLVYGFRILAGACSDLDIYVVPEGCQVTVFTKDGADMPVASETGVGYLNLKEDGVYRLEMTDGVHSYQTEFTVDHEAPVFDVLVEGSGAEISYGSDDIRYVEVTHGGETQTYTSLTMLNGSGTYEIAMYDEAGNCTVKTVEIPYRVNPAGVIAVILTLGLVAAAVIFVRNTKHNMNVK